MALVLVSWLSGGSSKAKRQLADYADECFVHAGAPGQLSSEQRTENLGAFIVSIDRRIARLRALAAELGSPLPQVDGSRGNVEATSQALDHLCKSKLSGLTEIESALAMDWRARKVHGPERHAHTLAIDLGAYCGEIGIRCAPRYQWLIDETRYTPKTIMETSGRVVLGHNPAVVATAMNSHVDAIAIAGFALWQIVHHRRVKAKSLWRPNYFHFLSDLADGRYS